LVRPNEVRKTIIEMLYRARASHLGPCLSVVEMLAAVYDAVDLAAIRDRRPDRDRVIVSKGHCAAAVYATLMHHGLLDSALAETYCRDGSLLAGHVSHAVACVEHSTGALGHGLPVAAGCALGLRARGFDWSNVYCILGDGELQEGSVWEALMLAAHNRLTNLVVLVDNNRISSIRRTAEVIDLSPLEERFAAFGYRPLTVDGHDLPAVRKAIGASRRREWMSALICNTVKGRGVPFAEDDPIWHYRTLSQEQYRRALDALEETVAA